MSALMPGQGIDLPAKSPFPAALATKALCFFSPVCICHATRHLLGMRQLPILHLADMGRCAVVVWWAHGWFGNGEERHTLALHLGTSTLHGKICWPLKFSLLPTL